MQTLKLGKFKVFEVYSGEHDITTIFRDEYNFTGDLVSTEVVGFYYGQPNQEDTKIFTGKLKADFI
jgi:hypothetical protein